eukprot:scaffold16045_cov110-Isochrysis_galbana.AAC.2
MLPTTAAASVALGATTAAALAASRSLRSRCRRERLLLVCIWVELRGGGALLYHVDNGIEDGALSAVRAEWAFARRRRAARLVRSSLGARGSGVVDAPAHQLEDLIAQPLEEDRNARRDLEVDPLVNEHPVLGVQHL